MQEDRNAELHACFNRSYEAVLKPHLSFFVRPVVSVRASVRFVCLSQTLFPVPPCPAAAPPNADTAHIRGGSSTELRDLSFRGTSNDR